MIETFLAAANADLAGAAGATLLAGIVYGFTGFGSALVMVPLVAIIYGPVEAVALMAIAAVPSTLPILPRAWPKVSWRPMAPILVTLAVTAPLGTIFLVSVDPVLIKRLVGITVVAIALLLIFGWKYRGPRNWFTGSLAGAATGWITGFAGVGGPPMVLYILSMPDEVEVQRANIVMVMVVVTTSLLISIFVAGAVSAETLARSVVLIPVHVVAAWAGAKWFFATGDAFYRRLALAVLVGAGVSAMIF